MVRKNRMNDFLFPLKSAIAESKGERQATINKATAMV